MDANKASDQRHRQEEDVEDVPNPPFSQWGIHWKAPTLILLFYALSMCSAFSHHVLYQIVDGRTPTRQDWILRAGTALATLCKLFLAASVATAFSQTVWKVVRDNMFTVSSLDTLFSATRIPWSLIDGELLSKAKVALFLAAVIWLTPLIPVFTPGSLTVALKTTFSTVTMHIQNLNIFNTNNESTGRLDFISYDYLSDSYRVESEYIGPSRAGLSIIYQSVFQGEIMKSASPCGLNCSFTQSFKAPTYKCEDVDGQDPEAPWCYAAGQKPNGTCYINEPASKNLFFAGNGSDWSYLWVRQRYFSPENRRNITTSFSSKSGYTYAPDFEAPYENITFRCGMWLTEFNITRTFTNSAQIISGIWTPISPFDTESLRSNWTARAIHEELVSIFGISLSFENTNTVGVGEVWIPPTGLGLTGTRFVESYPWEAPLNSLPVHNFKALLEEVTANITLSMLAVPELSYLYPDDTLVQTTTTEPVWTYDDRALIVTYGIALGIGLVCVLLGVAAMMANGVYAEGEFMAVLATTRNPAIDEAVGGACLGASGRSLDELKKVRLRYGEIPSSRGDGRRHAAFGLRNQVTPLEKGLAYE